MWMCAERSGNEYMRQADVTDGRKEIERLIQLT